MLKLRSVLLGEEVQDDEPGAAPSHGYKPGDIWKTANGNWRAMSPKGNVNGFGIDYAAAKLFASTGDDQKTAKNIDTEEGEQDPTSYYRRTKRRRTPGSGLTEEL